MHSIRFPQKCHFVFFLLSWLNCAINVSAAGGRAKLPSEDIGRGFYKFVTRPDIDAPIWDIRIYRDGKTAIAPGYFFVSFYGQLDQAEPGDSWLGPHVYDQWGELIWSGASAFKHWNVFDFGLESEQTGDAITLLSDHDKKGYILDNTYQIRKEVGLLIDGESESNMHAFHVIDNGTRALVLNRQTSPASAEESQLLGFDGTCLIKYEGFREFDLETQGFQPLFEWHAKDHIALDESNYTTHNANITKICREGWDIFHLNSVDKFPDGDYLLSARHTNAVYKVSHTDGSIIWRLGGSKSDFEFENAWRFSRQHHARVRSQNETHTIITLFDNAVGDGIDETPTHEYSRGLIISLSTQSMTAQIVMEYPHPDRGLTEARGSFQTLPNGNPLICWAYNSHITEYAPYGKIIMQAKLDVKVNTYRAFKYPWIGRPVQPPDVVSQALYNGSQTLTQVHMSWNGATEIASWRVYEVHESGKARLMGSANRIGFETSATYNGFARAVFAEALDARNISLGKSGTVYTTPPTKMGVESSIWHAAETDESPQFNSDEPSAADEPDEQHHPDSQSDLESTNESEDSTQSSVPSSSLIGLTIVIALAGIATVVGLTLELLVPQISTRRISSNRTRDNVQYENLKRDEDMEDMAQLDKG